MNRTLLFVAGMLLGWVLTDVVRGSMNTLTPYVLVVGLLILVGGLTKRALDGATGAPEKRALQALDDCVEKLRDIPTPRQ